MVGGSTPPLGSMRRLLVAEDAVFPGGFEARLRAQASGAGYGDTGSNPVVGITCVRGGTLVDTLVSGTSAGEPAWGFDSPWAHQPGGRGPGLTSAAAGGEANPRNPANRRRTRAHRAGTARRWIGATVPERGRCRFESGRALGDVAHLVERPARNRKAVGSTPTFSTMPA